MYSLPVGIRHICIEGNKWYFISCIEYLSLQMNILNFHSPAFPAIMFILLREPNSTRIMMFTCYLMCDMRFWKFSLYKSIYCTLFLHYPISPSPACTFVDARSHYLMRVRSPNFTVSLIIHLTTFLLYFWIVEHHERLLVFVLDTIWIHT